MTVASEHSPLANAAERLIASLTGVVSARVVANQAGEFVEIHVLATADLHPKQMARNVESALSAGLGIEIDRRIISIAQVREPAVSEGSDVPPAGAAAAGEDSAGAARGQDTGEVSRTERSGRIIFVGFDTRYLAERHAVCRVTLSRDGIEYTGTSEGTNTLQGRVQAAAQAAFAALAELGGREHLGLEGASLTEAHGRTYVVVAARALHGRRAVALSGVAPVSRSPEEAAILASLQAANRRIDLPC